MKRIAVDIGGTFTDIVYIDETTMQILVDKVRSTPWDIGQAVMDAIKKIQVDLSEVDLFIHGTTAGINTIVQKKGSKMGLISTQGFTDVLEMARGNKKELYDYMWKKPKPLVPRYLRLGVHERTTHSGEIIEKLDEKEVKEIIKKLKENGIEAIAVCLLHSYANPENERRLGEIVKAVWPEVTLALSHQVAREIREYERTSTTVINAYIEKAVVHYLGRLNGNLKEAGFVGQLLVLGPSGVLGIEAVNEKAIYTLASGPIGGAAGAAHLAGLCGIKDLVTMDVGGTSFDVSVVKDGVNVEKHQTEIMGYPVLMAGMDIRPIGAGGGSIARVDAAGLLTVGPESAGANPGPMAYGMGGREPTVTDAALVNGLIDPDYFLGGEVLLNLDLAKRGVSDIANKLGLSLHEAADGILSVARNNMTTATMEILVGQGFDPRDFALMSYGGAGGIFATSLAKDMSISRVIVPPEPGVFSARGILAMNLVHTYAQAYIRAMNELDIGELEDIYEDMENGALKILTAEGISRDAIEFMRSLDICFEGQRYYVETAVPMGKLLNHEKIKREIRRSFEQLYEMRYGHLINAPLRTINTRLKAMGKIKEISVSEIRQGKEIHRKAMKRGREVYLDGNLMETQIYERAELLCGNSIPGPAIIEEPFHTTVVMPGQKLEVDKLGNLIISSGGA
ncbi:MAG: hydantoinase/oxoprolinase family protein [Thermodesulfobacteriota bacterium]|jgi:N-methylhydantoinase A